MNGAVWWLEWTLALRRRRLFVLNILIPLTLVAVVAWSGAPAPHAAAVFAILFVLFGTFGSAIPLLRDVEHGIFRRVASTALTPRTHLLQRTLAGAALDAVQLAPALGVAILARGGGLPLALFGGLVLAASLCVAAVVGLWVAAWARSIAEGALFSALTALLLLHASGVFRSPRPGSIGALLEAGSPYRALHEVLLRGVGLVPPPAGEGSGGLLEGLSGPLAEYPGTLTVLVSAALAFALTAGFAARLERRLLSVD